MTMIDNFDMKCGACGEVSSQPVLLSTNSFGYPDLDLRPPSMQRETMGTWVLECPHCGYVAGDLEVEPEISRDFLKSERYLTCDGFDFKGELASIFYRDYLIMNESGNDFACFTSLKCCAWDCDDHDDGKNARKIRKLAVTYLDRFIQLNREDVNDLLVMKSDMLRRAGEFDRVVEEFEGLRFDEDIYNKVISFQIQKARLADDACYTLQDVHEAAG